MKKAFIGGRLRRLREERGLTQTALAASLELSPSYLNQIEKNQRPLTVPVLLRINAVFGIDVQLFSENDEARLLSELREILSDPNLGDNVSLTEIRDLVSNMPGIARGIATLHRRLRAESDRAEALVAHLGFGMEAPIQPAPFEEVRDFFYTHHNYFDELDTYAEQLSEEARLVIGEPADGLADHLDRRHGIRLTLADDGPLRRWDAASRTLTLLRRLSPSQRAYQMATQLALIELDGPIEALAGTAVAGRGETRGLARIGLANYVAGALLMPYRAFRSAAESSGYDIEKLSERFGVGFESVCHRLSSLQRPGAPGVPFFLIRVDRAGNISKRQSATDFHFSRVGGSCPLWNVYEAFAHPGRVVVQIARMPDGRAYLWVARTVDHGRPGYGATHKTFSVALGCDLRHAGRLVYAKGLDLADPDAATPIGSGCKVCERETCVQRAFPFVGRPLTVDETRSMHAPYAAS